MTNVAPSTSIFGYFTEANQSTPAFDPGLGVPCPFCLRQLEIPVRTTSLMAEDDNRSFFYRAHVACVEKATEVEVTQIEGALIDGLPNTREQTRMSDLPTVIIAKAMIAFGIVIMGALVWAQVLVR